MRRLNYFYRGQLRGQLKRTRAGHRGPKARLRTPPNAFRLDNARCSPGYVHRWARELGISRPEMLMKIQNGWDEPAVVVG